MGKHKTPAERDIAIRVGARIRQLREIQHLSQIRLATEIGIRAGPLGWIEKGKHLPSGRVLYRIAKQLNVRIDDLFEESNVWESSGAVPGGAVVLLPPSGVESPGEEVKSAHIVCQTVAEKVVALEKLCGSAVASALPLTVPFPATEAGAACLAAQVRAGLGLGDRVLRDYIDVLEQSGVRVLALELPEGCDSFAGYVAETRSALVFVNLERKRQPEYLTERIAFELGRVFFKARGACDTEWHGVPEQPLLDESAFAQRFAAHFLMPAEAMQATTVRLGLVPKAWTFELLLRVKRRFGVTAKAFAERLHELGLSWSDKQKRSPRHFLFKEEVEALAGQPERGVSSAPLALGNGALNELLLRAETCGGAPEQKALAAIRKVLRQAGLKLEA